MFLLYHFDKYIPYLSKQNQITMKSTSKKDSRWLKVNFNKTECGTDFYINTGTHIDLSQIISINNSYQTDCFEP